MDGTCTVKFPWRTMKTSITNIMKRYFSKSYKHTHTHTMTTTTEYWELLRGFKGLNIPLKWPPSAIK